jgi:hypothetical protein
MTTVFLRGGLFVCLFSHQLGSAVDAPVAIPLFPCVPGLAILLHDAARRDRD